MSCKIQFSSCTFSLETLLSTLSIPQRNQLVAMAVLGDFCGSWADLVLLLLLWGVLGSCSTASADGVWGLKHGQNPTESPLESECSLGYSPEYSLALLWDESSPVACNGCCRGGDRVLTQEQEAALSDRMVLPVTWQYVKQ